jgi:hypothetical protein
MPSTLAAVVNYSGNFGSFHMLSHRRNITRSHNVFQSLVVHRLPCNLRRQQHDSAPDIDDHAQGKENRLSLDAIPHRSYRLDGLKVCGPARSGTNF